MCNFCFNIITKILASRLAKILPKIIEQSQTGFIKEIMIHNNILIGQKIMGLLGKKVDSSNVVIKLDMSKAYDRVHWLFWTKTLRKFISLKF